MKKKHIILPLLGIAVLSSCNKGYGQEITSDKARVAELGKGISEKMNEKTGFEAHIVGYMGASYKDKEVANRDTKYSWDVYYRGDDKGNISLGGGMTIKSGEEKMDYAFNLFQVNDPEYGEVDYTELFYPGDPDHKQIDVHYENESNEAGYMNEGLGIMAFPIAFFDAACFPYYLGDEVDTEYGTVTVPPRKLYSNGDGNLTIEMPNTKERESNSSSYTRITYDNYVLKDAVFESTEENTSYTQTEKFELKYKVLPNYKIALPDGWKDHIGERTTSSMVS
ncbi:MAG: hypothetical protein IKI55_01765 [Bacilli bacterium]|nr:hypothetical protein [Bacilli bacterium]